jgi:DNA-binding CsgD family transcriptional regulator
MGKDILSGLEEKSRVSLGLTKAEAGVFRLVGAGMSNDAIAAKLFVSLGTVRTHLKSIYKLIGSSDRYSIVSIWFTFLADQGKIDGGENG